MFCMGIGNSVHIPQAPCKQYNPCSGEFHTKGLLYLRVAVCKCCAGDDAALFFCPGSSVRVCSARILAPFGIWTRWRHFPAVSKLYHISYHRLTPSGKVIDAISIKVSTQATNLTLHKDVDKITKVNKTCG